MDPHGPFKPIGGFRRPISRQVPVRTVSILDPTSSYVSMPRPFASTHPRASTSMTTWLFCAAVATFPVFTVADAGAQQTERRTLSGREVSVYNLVGEVTVEAGSGSG